MYTIYARNTHTCTHKCSTRAAAKTIWHALAQRQQPLPTPGTTHTHTCTHIAAPGQQLKQSGLLSPNGSSRYPPQAQHIHTHVHTNAAPGQQLKQSGLLSPNGSSRYPPQAHHIYTHVHTNAAPGQQLKQSGLLSPNGSSRYPTPGTTDKPGGRSIEKFVPSVNDSIEEDEDLDLDLDIEVLKIAQTGLNVQLGACTAGSSTHSAHVKKWCLAQIA